MTTVVPTSNLIAVGTTSSKTKKLQPCWNEVSLLDVQYPNPHPVMLFDSNIQRPFGQCCQRVDVMENGSSPCRKSWNSDWIWISTAKSWINLPDLHLRIIQTLLENKKKLTIYQNIQLFHETTFSLSMSFDRLWDFVVQALPETRTKRSRWCSSATESSNEMASQFTLIKGQKSSNENDGRVGGFLQFFWVATSSTVTRFCYQLF